MSDDRLVSPKAPSDADNNSNSGSLFSRRYPDESSSSSNGSKENMQLLLNNESSLSPKSQSHGAETIPTTRRCRRFDDAFPEGLKFQPKMTREDSIDLATNEEKSNSCDEWFIHKINPKSGTHSIDGEKNSGNSQVSRGTTREDIQKCMMKRLVEIRLKNQDKRKAMYDADNEITFDGSKSLEIDLCGHMGDEGNKMESDAGENPPKNNMAMNDEVNHGLIEYKAELDNVKKAISKENEINEEKKNIEDNEVEATRENKDIKLNEEGNRDEDTANEDQREDWSHSGKEACGSLLKHDNASHLPDNETDSFNLSDEETDSDEYGGSSLVDDLLSDVAENCSGSFEYPEEDYPKPLEYFNSEEYYRLVRKRKRRLVLSNKFYNEENIKAWRRSAGLPKKVQRIPSLHWDDEDDEACSTSDHKEETSPDDVDDDCEKDEIQPSNEENDDEDRQVEDVGEVGSNDELERVCERQIAQKQKRQKRCEYIDEEASLSGDDVGSDESDEEQMSVYEAEEGDNDELPDDETIKEQLNKQWIKQQRDEEERKLLYWKDRLRVDDVADETDRTFRFKLRLAKNESVDEEIDNVTVETETVEIDDDELCKRRREISKWKVEERKTELHAESISMKETNPLLEAASKVTDRGSLDGNSQSHERADISLSKNSLLHHRKSLPNMLNQTENTLYTKSADPDSIHADRHTEVYYLSRVLQNTNQQTTTKSGNVKLYHSSHT
ncbi:unnamed protein product [Cercopithifilaria johnstoni]|uniref:Claspin n=1 Tax=Cercopithifilaria johnstoni TaxID=2874296 RepID=A0A8J2Q296_9BILA|nr:unnamed protein product [Cercopithifilaria johnstoni]